MNNRRRKISNNESFDRVIRIRSWVIIVFFALCLLLILTRSFKLQVLDHKKFAQVAKENHLHKIALRPNRGTIFDRNDEPLAVTVETDSIFARPKRIKSPAKDAQRIAQALDLEVSYTLRKLTSEKPFVWIKRQVTGAEAQRIRQVDIPGIGMIKESDRSYPFGQLGAALLGFTGVDLQGLAGIEAHFEKELRGEGGMIIGQRDALGIPLFPDGIVFEGTLKGKSLRMTIDANIQYFVDYYLEQAFRKSNAEGACAIVMDPHTGEILAMSSYPTFNPNFAGTHTPNIAVTSIFETGSTFKPFLLAAALDSGAIDLNDKIYCHKGEFRFGGHTIHDTHPYEELLPEEIIKVSSNIGATQIGMRLGPTRWHEAMIQFGFGSKTGILFSGEPRGILRNPKKWRKIDIATSSYGQGVSVTPIQLTTAFCSLVNGGNLMRPILVSEVFDDSGRVANRYTSQIIRRVISRKTSEAVTGMMSLVTQEGGTGTLAAIPGFTVAGKTGTAQKPISGGYSPDKRISSFIGCVPADDPEITILVLFDDPKGSRSQRYGGVVAGPVFKKIAERTLHYRRRFESDDNLLEKLKLHVVERQNVTPSQKETDLARINPGKNRMPDLVGLSVRNALRIAEKRGLDLTVIGSGIAVRQSPNPGEKLDETKSGRVLFRPAS